MTMREILFRGKRIDNGEWVEGFYAKAKHIISEKEMHIIFQSGLELFPHSEFSSYEEVEQATICQYTGLKDKNGKRIFEGDLVQAVLPPSISQPSFVWPIMPVVFSDGVFGLQDQRGGVTPLKSFAPTVTFEVKGNIHDNPELVKGE